MDAITLLLSKVLFIFQQIGVCDHAVLRRRSSVTLPIIPTV